VTCLSYFCGLWLLFPIVNTCQLAKGRNRGFSCPFVRLHVCTDVCNHLYISSIFNQSNTWQIVFGRNGLIGRNKFVVRVRSLKWEKPLATTVVSRHRSDSMLLKWPRATEMTLSRQGWKPAKEVFSNYQCNSAPQEWLNSLHHQSSSKPSWRTQVVGVTSGRQSNHEPLG
jgi:hypothetical protein